MSNEALLTTMLENFVEKNINKFLNTKKEGLQDISVDNICPQNKYSSRPGGRMVIKYFDENKHLRKKIFWIKKLNRHYSPSSRTKTSPCS